MKPYNIFYINHGLVCVFPAADSTSDFEPLSAPSSQHPLRKEAGQAALVLHSFCTTISYRGTGYFWTKGRSHYDWEKTSQTGNHPARHPAAPAFLALTLFKWMLVGNTAPFGHSDQREESPTEQGSHLLFNSGWPLAPLKPQHIQPVSAVWHKYISPHPANSGVQWFAVLKQYILSIFLCRICCPSSYI